MEINFDKIKQNLTHLQIKVILLMTAIMKLYHLPSKGGMMGSLTIGVKVVKIVSKLKDSIMGFDSIWGNIYGMTWNVILLKFMLFVNGLKKVLIFIKGKFFDCELS